jgi:hypothetical protein
MMDLGGTDPGVRAGVVPEGLDEGEDRLPVGGLKEAGALHPGVAAGHLQGRAEDRVVLPAAEGALVHAGGTGGVRARHAVEDGLDGDVLLRRELFEGFRGSGEGWGVGMHGWVSGVEC